MEDQERKDEEAKDSKLIQKLEEKLFAVGDKCEDTLYGELLTKKLKKLTYNAKLRAKHEIDNIMFNYLSVEFTEQHVSSPISNQYAMPNQRYPIHPTPQMNQHEATATAGFQMTSSPNRVRHQETAVSPVFNRQRQFPMNLPQNQNVSSYAGGTGFYMQ